MFLLSAVVVVVYNMAIIGRTDPKFVVSLLNVFFFLFTLVFVFLVIEIHNFHNICSLLPTHDTLIRFGFFFFLYFCIFFLAFPSYI